MSERCFFTREKKVVSNQNRARCFFMCENTDMSNQKPQRCASFAPKFQPFIGAGSLHRPRLTSCFTDIQREKFFSKRFSRKKVKNISETGVEYKVRVCLLMKKIVEIRQNNSGQRKRKNRTRLHLKKCFLSELLCLLFSLRLYSNQLFSTVYSEQNVNIIVLVILRLPIYLIYLPSLNF